MSLPEAVPAKDVKARAAEWLMERRFSENWTGENEAQLEVWLQQSLAHRVAFVRLQSAWQRTDRLAALRRPSVKDSALAKLNALRPAIVRAAAAFVALVLVGGLAGAIFLAPRERSYATSVGEHQSVLLADGSRIELNTNTALRVAADQRTVHLDRGEAYFHIEHDAARPFIVLAAAHRVVDLGTVFTVRADAGRLKVALLEGAARVESADGWVQPHRTELKPGDIVVATAESLSVTRASTKNMANALGWRKGVLIFDKATLTEAVAEFNRYNRNKILIGNAAAGNLTIYGTFRADNSADFVSLARDVLGLRIERRNANIVIYR